MKKITTLSAICAIMLMMAGSAYAKEFTCVCLGRATSPMDCGSWSTGYADDMQGKAKFVDAQYIDKFLKNTEPQNIPSGGYAEDKIGGWLCLKK